VLTRLREVLPEDERSRRLIDRMFRRYGVSGHAI